MTGQFRIRERGREFLATKGLQTDIKDQMLCHLYRLQFDIDLFIKSYRDNGTVKEGKDLFLSRLLKRYFNNLTWFQMS